MSSSKKKISVVFGALLFAAILLIPATAFNANAQEGYKEKMDDYIKYDNYYVDKNQYNEKDNYGKQSDRDKKKSPKLTVKKELFVCDSILGNGENDNGLGFSFTCIDSNDNILPPNSDRYIECDESICPGIDESTFSVFVHKDVAFIQDLTDDGTIVNLDKFHYTVSEDELDERNGFSEGECVEAGFIEQLTYDRFFKVSNLDLEYEICVLYEGDCQGTIYPGEEKTCTVKNYIVSGNGFFSDIPSIGSISTPVETINNIVSEINEEIEISNNVTNSAKKPETTIGSIMTNSNKNNNNNNNDKLNTIVSTPTITVDNEIGKNNNNDKNTNNPSTINPSPNNNPSTINPSPNNNPSIPTTTFILPSIG